MRDGPPAAVVERVVDALAALEPATVQQVAGRAAVSSGDAAAALQWARDAGLVRRSGGRWRLA